MAVQPSVWRWTVLTLWGAPLALMIICGCGQPGTSGPEGASEAPQVTTRGVPPVAAISATGKDEFENAAAEAVDATSPEGLLREIAKSRAELFPAEGDPVWNDRVRARHENIIELARRVISATHDQADHVQSFNNAVHYLSDSRVELAIHGDTDQSQLLLDDAEALYRRDPQSFAAVESASKVVQLAQRMAEQHGAQNPDWLSEFAAQARLFAEKFPQEPNRGALGLMSAGQLCDRHGQVADAERCFQIIASKFADTIFADQVHGYLRRLSLQGQPLELAGPTLDGGFVSVDDFHGQHVLVTFWASTAPAFSSDVERLEMLHSESAATTLKYIGVSLDVDESAIDGFLDKHSLPWPHIFYSEPEQRGIRHPAARYYGVQQAPYYILVDEKGTVISHGGDLDAIAESLPQRQ